MAQPKTVKPPGEGKAKNTNVAKRTKEDFSIDRTIDVNGNEVPLLVKVSVNRKNGNIKIGGALTTKHVSLENPEDTRNSIAEFAEMITEGVGFALAKRKEWTDNPKTNQIQLTFDL
jgi:ABC-type transporter MlaC component